MSWVMAMTRTERPITYGFHIGEVKVAEITFAGREVLLRTMSNVTEHANMSEAMREMHRRLNAPSPEGSRVGRMRQ